MNLTDVKLTIFWKKEPSQDTEFCHYCEGQIFGQLYRMFTQVNQNESQSSNVVVCEGCYDVINPRLEEK